MSVRMGCPYLYCSAVIEAYWMRPRSDSPPGVERLMVPHHTIRNSILRGTCPASHIWLPVDEQTAEHLTAQSERDRRTIEAHMERQQEGGETDTRGCRGGMFPLTSRRPSGIPLRLGREPATEGPERDHWFPPRPPDEEPPHIKPPGVAGHQLGSRGMATVEDMIRQINDANLKAGEAIGALATAKDEIHAVLAQLIEVKNRYGNAFGEVIQSRDLVAMTMEQAGSSATLGDMLALLQQAIDDQLTPGAVKFDPMQGDCGYIGQTCDEATTNCQAAMEKGEQFIGNMMG